MGLLDRLFNTASVPAYRLAVCAIVKDENGYLAEWIGYHAGIGVEHFYLYDNGSRIPIVETLAELGLTHLATVRTYRGVAVQAKAYSDCIRRFGSESRWMAFIDVDEFIVPKNDGNNVADLLASYEEYGGIGMNWLVFGSSGHLARTNRPQLESFQMRSDANFSVNRHIKSIVQPRYVRKAANPHYFKFKKGKFTVSERFERIPHSFSDVSTELIQLNHYYCRSLEEYQDKIARGLADDGRRRDIAEFYYHDKDSNKVRDTTILDILRGKK
ncbi:glycosyltransferase family 92 protein [Mucilaginibacter sp. FT3.2]|uniref:glycosyltransferase family 92 protein n=1 Tax=Mucilaginibacter sp. FT3.2 TaxID=2723090 RepID=UPI00161C98C2|nr:glycosyltransferase family 92 protein [Mucilaginibacter sp. FT3.2]MBB6230682.1 hypothetical protein [Mucilaginibacter sp. FT3.2]